MLLSFSKILKCFFVALSLLPCYVNKFILIGYHISFVLLFYLMKHLVFVEPIEAPRLLSSLLSVKEAIHYDWDCFCARFASIAIECNFFQLGFVPDFLALEFFFVHFGIELNLCNFFLQLLSDTLLRLSLLLVLRHKISLLLNISFQDSVLFPDSKSVLTALLPVR